MNTHMRLRKAAREEMKAGRPIIRENTASQTARCSITMLHRFKTLMAVSPSETPSSALLWALYIGRGPLCDTNATDQETSAVPYW